MTDTAATNRPSEQPPSGQSGGGAPRPGRAASVEDQPTVISKQPPIIPGTAAVGPWPDIRPGTSLAHFQLLEHIGGGGMGQVYRALDTRLGRTVALKVLSAQQAADQETLLRFRNEARSAARLNHQGIAQVYFVGEDRGAAFIAFEFVEGTNIRDVVEQRGPLPLAEALYFTLQVAEALAHAAARNVVHRDIKPSNVLITPNGTTKLIDLGLARMQSLGGAASDLTASGVTLGTFDYISPEQARDPRNADVRSDIYSLGCTLFYMLAGRPPFPEGTVLQKLLQHQGDEPPDIRTFRREIPEEVSQLLKRMMAKAPDGRFQSAEKLIEAILEVADRLGLRLVGRGQLAWVLTDRPAASRIRQHLPWALPVAVLVIVVFILHFVWSPETGQFARPDENNAGQKGGSQLPWFAEEPVTGPPIPVTDPLGSQPSETSEAGRPNRPPGPNRPDGATSSGDASPAAVAAESVQQGGSAGQGREAGSDGGVDPPDGPGEPKPAGQSVGPAGQSMSPSADPAGPGGTVVPLSAGAPPVGTSPGPPSQIAPADSSAGETEPRSRVLVVDPSGQYPEALSSLGAALARAASGDVIQLRYNGPNERDERAFSLADLALTIRAAPGFRPVVRYVPKSDPALYPSAMFSLTGAHVIMEGLALELEVPAEMAVESWSMFEMGPADQLELRRCWLTVRNSAAQPEAAFFRLRAPLALSLRRRNGPDNARRPARLTLSDCVARGEAALLSAEDAVPAEVAWNNGLLVTTQQLLRARGTDRSPGPADQLRIQLDHVTAAVGGSLCAWSDGLLAPRQLPTQIISSHCVLQGNNTAPLGIQETVKDVEEVLATVQWHGRGNCYGGFSSFWVVRSAAKGGQPRTWSLAQWLQRVGPESETGSVAIESPWRRPPPVDLPVSQHLPADYLLRDGVGAGDSVGAGPPGFALDELPDPPPEAVPPAGQSTAPRATAPMDPGP